MDYQRQKPKVSKSQTILLVLLGVLIVAGFAVFKHYVDGGFTWFGGRRQLAYLVASGAYFGMFPALAGLAAAVHRITVRKTADGAAALSAGIIWLVQYAIILLVTGSIPSVSDLDYGIVSVLSVAMLAKFMKPKLVDEPVRRRSPS